MTKATFAQFLQYLQDELSISHISIEQTLQSLGQDSHLLPIALWQYGVLTLNQLNQVYDWLADKRREVADVAWVDAIASS